MAFKYPEIGLLAVLELAGFKKNANQYFSTLSQMDKVTKQTAQKVNQSGGNIVQTWEALAQQSKALGSQIVTQFTEQKDIFAEYEKHTAQINELRAAFAGLKRGVKVNVDTFDEFMQKGYSVGDALKAATGQALGAEQSISILGRSFTTTAFAIGTFTAVAGAAITVLKTSITEYEDYANQIRKLQLVLGTTSTETAAWAKMARDAGVDVAVITRSVTLFERQLLSLYTAQSTGKTVTTNFSRALGLLEKQGLALKDEKGFRGTIDVFRDIVDILQKMPEGSERSAIAMSLFGRVGSDILPVLFDVSRSLEEEMKQVDRLGLAMGNDIEMLQNWRQAKSDLADVFTKFYAYISRDVLPTLNVLAKVVKWIGIIAVDTAVKIEAFTNTLIKFVAGGGRVQMDFLGELEKEYERLAGKISEAQKAQEEKNATDSRGLLTTLLLAEAEGEREETIRGLYEKLADLREQYNDKLVEIEESFAQRWEDILTKRRRDRIEREMRLAWELADLWADYNQRLVDAQEDLAEKRQERQRDYERKIREFEEDTRERREDLEKKHQERLLQIQLDYQDAIGEAVRHNDAVAVLQAMRKRAKDLRDEQRKYESDRTELEEDLTKRRAKIEEDRREREAEDEVERQRTMERIQRDYERRLEELRIQQERERIMREMQWRWEEEDFARAKTRQLAEARKWYEKERADLRAQLAEMGVIVSGSIQSWGNMAAQQTSAAIRRISSAAATEIQRYGHLLIRVAGGLGTATGGATGTTSPPAPAIAMAEGGTIIARSPTQVLMGEAGPEMATFAPLSRSMTVNHKFSRMGIDMNGVPGGMNISQVEGLMWRVMTQVAQELLAGA